MKKNSTPPIPAYYRLQTTIQSDIETGRWKPGECIPSEKKLAEIHSVSIGTVKRALLNLAYEGYLYRAQGKGTYVSGTTLNRDSLRYYHFLKDFEDEEATLKVRLLDLALVKSFHPANRYLRIRRNQNLYEMKRIFLSEGEPIVYTISYLPERLFKNLKEFPKPLFEKITLYKMIEQNYGFPTVYNRELFQPVPASSEIATILGIEEATPILFIEMLSFTYRDKPYEYRMAYCHMAKRKLFREI